MTSRLPLALAALALLLWTQSARPADGTQTAGPQASADDASAAVMPASHTVRDIEGWQVHVDDRLLDGADKELGSRAVKLLANRLFLITVVVPADKVKRLQEVGIYLDLHCGKLKVAQYHPGAGWLKDNGYDPVMVKCVHIPSAAEFCRPNFQREQPWAVLHELAHAYHDQVLDFDNPEIKAAWQAFVDSGKYKSVLHVNGSRHPHYALTNQMEFFSEMTETYFGMNDFFPFNSGELRHEEPALFALMEKIWGKLP